MGWFRDDYQGHEGYLVGFRDDGNGFFSEITSRTVGRAPAPTVRYVSSACECGWRSPHLIAPLGCRWVPSMIEYDDTLHADFDQLVRDLWDLHLWRVGRGRTGFPPSLVGPSLDLYHRRLRVPMLQRSPL